MRIGVIGINHKLADLKLRETLAKACLRYFSSPTTSHPHHSFVPLSTCNRTEIYFSSDNLAASHSYLLQFLDQVVDDDFEQKLYSFFAHDCFKHLVSVSAGLDSAIIGETEIQGQVKAAYAKAKELTALPHDVHYLFQKSLKISKTIRMQMPHERGHHTLEDALYRAGKQRFDNPKVLFVGASAINLKILNYFKQRNIPTITLCNRTNSKSLSLGKKLSIHTLPWNQLELWHTFDCIIFGTKAQTPLILSCPEVASPKLLIDLCVPRNVCPSLEEHPMVTLLNIDEINLTIQQQKHSLSLAHEEIHNHTLKHMALFKKKTRHHSAAIFHCA